MTGPLLNRLLLTPDKLVGLADGLKQIAADSDSILGAATLTVFDLDSTSVFVGFRAYRFTVSVSAAALSAATLQLPLPLFHSPNRAM